MKPWDLKRQFLESVKEKGGFVNCHGHYDKAFYINKDSLDKTMLDMEVKWRMSDDLKRSSSEDQIADRIREALDIMIAQGSQLTSSFVDAYDAVGHKSIDAALRVKEEYKNKINFLIMTQPLGGLVNREARVLFEAISAKADIVGGLPSRDRPQDELNWDVLFSIAKNLNKPLHVHVDQENNPNERDTEKLIHYTIRHGYEGRVVAIHTISVAAQPKEYRKNIYQKLTDVGIPVVICPSAALGMRQLDQYAAPVHNSIANLTEMLEAGVLVGLGVDNISDFYQPFIDGDMWVEMRVLQEACRYYHFDNLVSIASENGRKILGMT